MSTVVWKISVGGGSSKGSIHFRVPDSCQTPSTSATAPVLTATRCVVLRPGCERVFTELLMRALAQSCAALLAYRLLQVCRVDRGGKRFRNVALAQIADFHEEVRGVFCCFGDTGSRGRRAVAKICRSQLLGVGWILQTGQHAARGFKRDVEVLGDQLRRAVRIFLVLIDLLLVRAQELHDQLRIFFGEFLADDEVVVNQEAIFLQLLGDENLMSAVGFKLLRERAPDIRGVNVATLPCG